MTENVSSAEVFSLTTADGEELFFQGDVFRLPSWGNFGSPPIEYLTRQGYKQHGVTLIDYTLGSRPVPFQIFRDAACSRSEYWENRAEILDFIRPNRNGEMTLTVLMPDGASRSLLVMVDPGLPFPPKGGENSWQIDDPLEFIAFNPIWFDSDATELTLTNDDQEQLVFPITFPISFGTSNAAFTTGTIHYEGTWPEYPTITLTGPYTTATIINQTTGAVLIMQVAIGAGEQRIIRLTPGQQSIVDSNGINKFSDLGPSSDLVNFAIQPAPIVPNGDNTITITMVDGTGASAAEIDYRARYYGI